MSSEHWPESMTRIAEVIGEEATLRLVAAYGGVKGVYIPRGSNTGHSWSRVVGQENWDLLCARFGGRSLDLPRGVFIKLKKQAILELGAEGVPQRKIALRLGVTERYVSHVLCLVPNRRQLKLFQD